MSALLVKDMFGINDKVLKILANSDESWEKIYALWESVKGKRFDTLTPDQIESLEAVEMDVSSTYGISMSKAKEWSKSQPILNYRDMEPGSSNGHYAWVDTDGNFVLNKYYLNTEKDVEIRHDHASYLALWLLENFCEIKDCKPDCKPDEDPDCKPSPDFDPAYPR